MLPKSIQSLIGWRFEYLLKTISFFTFYFNGFKEAPTTLLLLQDYTIIVVAIAYLASGCHHIYAEAIGSKQHGVAKLLNIPFHLPFCVCNRY